MTCRVLVVEDGREYSEMLTRFLTDGFSFVRAGNGGEALAALATGEHDVVFLDMRFDRIPEADLVGDLAEITNRFNGDRDRAVRFLEDNQGTFVLATLRAAGHRVPVVFSYDFDGEPRRWGHVERHHGPVAYLGSNAGPDQIRAALEGTARSVSEDVG
ncbi:MAG: response regulator [Proteobacteria bacterium]|nr:response regulator [Pseudomonadota bacterium]MCP4919336.1 response regulator [Pseudomonadota bacterium]